MKTMLLWGAVALTTLIVVFAFVLGREPAGGQAHSVNMPQQMQPATAGDTLCLGLEGAARDECIKQNNITPGQIGEGAITPSRDAAASESAARAARGSGVEGVPSSGVTIAPRQ
jgi:hypothetical protein